MNDKNTTQFNHENVKVGEETSPTLLRFFRRKWLGIWQSNPPGMGLFVFGLCIAVIMAIPIVYVIWRSLFAGIDRWQRLLDERIPQLLWNTLSLAGAVTVSTMIIGVSLAWIVIRTDIPGKKAWRWLLAMPLTVPPYVGAVTYIIVFGRSGWARDLWQSTPWLVNALGDYSINIYSFGGVFLVLTMFTYPYVYLIASASLRKMNRNYEEAAYSQGMSTSEVFWKVNLPLLRPAIGAGGILVSLYVLGDFGTIAMLRYVTFTAAIYFQRASFDTASAAVLSLVLILLTVAILWIESKTRRKNKYYQTSNTYRKPLTLKLGKWKPFVLFYVSVVFFVSVILPIGVLVYWSRIGIRMGALDGRFFGFAINSLKVSGFAALLCMLFSMPIIYLKGRYPSLITKVIEKLSYAGYALPGVIVALGFVFIFNNHLPRLYGTFYIVALAFVVRFLPQAMQAGEASLSLISPRIDEAARSLGYPPWKVMLKVILPNMLPGVLAGGALVFVSAIKELPATLMLRPPNFDTLAVRVYFEASESIYHLAAPAALLIVLVSVVPLRYMLKKY
ncbi:binding-protein-dependent transport systems inner membrane component [Alkaliphilus metalliredigens QYMF]|uniref:Binding-protein-dependent transport systems inner membrane component n=1 Tax=Alkaliphilus metalliredigens (strain QYMF) TaxID=293826 RepID=A6TWY1_ALKMQ|nr:iron ABC transporter permease [Alkaliphilus metalliredigens]ABR50699.1 binding-protein-dependent transport systems inner membrane component [Alkaliphilus metalliredigens QYMF]